MKFRKAAKNKLIQIYCRRQFIISLLYTLDSLNRSDYEWVARTFCNVNTHPEMTSPYQANIEYVIKRLRRLLPKTAHDAIDLLMRPYEVLKLDLSL